MWIIVIIIYDTQQIPITPFFLTCKRDQKLK